jgi:hypothetical protein
MRIKSQSSEERPRNPPGPGGPPVEARMVTLVALDLVTPFSVAVTVMVSVPAAEAAMNCTVAPVVTFRLPSEGSDKVHAKKTPERHGREPQLTVAVNVRVPPSSSVVLAGLNVTDTKLDIVTGNTPTVSGPPRVTVPRESVTQTP